MHSDLATRVDALLARVLDGATLDHRSLRRLSGGSNRETWSLDARGVDGRTHPLILQRRTRAVTDLFGIGVDQEAAVLRAAAAAAVPVPEVIAAQGDDSALGRPFLLSRRVEGETIPQRILSGEQFADVRPRLAQQYGEALGRLQEARLDGLVTLSAESPPLRYRRILGHLSHPYPALELGLRWLETTPPPAPLSARVLVHGDYRNGNGIVGPEGLRAVIDWEFAHLGDPLEDLAWFCLRAWRFGREEPVGGLSRYGPFLDAYTRVTARAVDLAALHWWMVLGSVRWGLICAIQAARHLSGEARSVELAAVGRRVSEAEFDLLLLLP